MNLEPARLQQLFGAHTDGTLTPEEHAELQALLRADPAARRLWFLHQDVQAGLHDLMQQTDAAPVLEPTTPPPQPRWYAWRPLTAAAAGVVIGLLSASVVLGLGVRSGDSLLSLVRDGFENAPPPLTAGVPPVPDRWGGDFSELTSEREGVKPAEGSSMVRMLRSDYEGRTTPRPSRQGDLMRVVDVRHLLRQSGGGEPVASLSALFNATPYSNSERYDAIVTIYALGAGTELATATEDSVKENALAYSIGQCGPVDRDPSSWQAASTQLLLPSGTEMLLLKISFRRAPVEGETLASLPDSQTFAGHFIDDVRASLRTRHTPAKNRSLERP